MDNAPETADGPELIQGSEPTRGPERADPPRHRQRQAIDDAIAEMEPALNGGARQARRGWQEASKRGPYWGRPGEEQ